MASPPTRSTFSVPAVDAGACFSASADFPQPDTPNKRPAAIATAKVIFSAVRPIINSFAKINPPKIICLLSL